MRLLFGLLLICHLGFSQNDILGRWKTVDDNSGHERSIVEIFKKGNNIVGKVTQIYPQPGEPPDPVCEECEEEDDRYNKKIVGMEIIRGMKLINNELSGGNILDPENGKVYRCKIWLEGNRLKVRGYLGPFYRTQTWLPAR
jgi:uncharacterized protein (DUF2147 family)